MFELMDSYSQSSAVILVIGIGGGGGNAVEHMLSNSVEGVEFVCANTDAQALKNSSARTVLQLGTSVTKGLGAGANPDAGRQAALEDRDRLGLEGLFARVLHTVSSQVITRSAPSTTTTVPMMRS